MIDLDDLSLTSGGALLPNLGRWQDNVARHSTAKTGNGGKGRHAVLFSPGIAGREPGGHGQ